MSQHPVARVPDVEDDDDRPLVAPVHVGEDDDDLPLV
jgi:hypothetical protein